jgi:hypothetical protein
VSTYDPVGTECLGPQPGTDTLMRVSGEIYGTTTDGQTYVCKNISGSSRKSFHAEGRAGDSSGYPDKMRALADGFVDHWRALGVQEVIYDRKRWSTDDGDPNWEPFRGDDPHTSHVHWSLTWDAAKNLTEAKIRAVLLGEPEEPDMPLSDEDLKAIRKVVDEVVADRIGDLGQDAAGRTIRRSVANAIRVISPKAH